MRPSPWLGLAGLLLVAAPAGAQGVCGGPGNTPRLVASQLEFGRVPGLASQPVQGAISVLVSCPRPTDMLPPFRVVAVLPADGVVLAGPAPGGPRVVLNAAPGSDGAPAAGMQVLVVQSRPPGTGRMHVRIPALLLGQAAVPAGAYAGQVTLQLRLD